MSLDVIPEATEERVQELQRGLNQVRERITAATKRAGRGEEPTLIVVTKFFPVTDLLALAGLGVRDVGENREQELLSKLEYLDEHAPQVRDELTVHFIGQLQSKKARRVGSLVDVVHTVDREKLLDRLAGPDTPERGPVQVLVQVDLAGDDAGRGGALPQHVLPLAEQIVANPGLQLRGLMAVAPLGEEPARAFAKLAEIRQQFLAEHPDATMLSAGMSHDLEEAVEIGATHLRVGSAILGSRPAPM